MVLILIMRPAKSFGIVTAELKQVTSLGQYMITKGTLTKERLLANHDNDQTSITSIASIASIASITSNFDNFDNFKLQTLIQLTTFCEELRHDSLYVKYANRKIFRHEKDFWATTDPLVKSHVKRMADMRLVKVVKLAETLGIPMLYVTDRNASLHISEQLHLNANAEVTPVMNFHRHAGGTAYRLQLRIDGQLIERLSDHRIVVLGYQPGMFVLDNTIYLLGDSFSAKLLLPFVQKPEVEIPQKMENDYFRRFILKHVTRAEINAEGFHITDISQPPRPCLKIETSINGSRLLSLRFVYGNTEYSPDTKSNGRVTLTEEDNGEEGLPGNFRFIRYLRNRDMEKQQMEQLRQVAGVELSPFGQVIINFKSQKGNHKVQSSKFKVQRIQSQTLIQLIDWLREYAPKLKAKGFDVVQPSDQIYYIGPLSVEQRDTWHHDWLQTDVTVVIDDGRIRLPFLDLRDTILRGEQEYMLPTGELLLIPQEWLQRYSDLLLIGQPKGQGFLRHRSQLTQEPFDQQSVTDQLPPSATIPGASAPGVPIPLPPSPSPQSNHKLQTSNFKPQTLKATLRPYQQIGFQWLWQNFEVQTGCCLSDEMGLGKTLQTIALLLKYKEVMKATQPPKPQPGMLFSDEEMRGDVNAQISNLKEGNHKVQSSKFKVQRIEGNHKFQTSNFKLQTYRTSLVVAPSSVVPNWYNELARFAPSLQVMTYTGDIAKRKDKRKMFMSSNLKSQTSNLTLGRRTLATNGTQEPQYDIVLTTYRTLLNDIEHLARQQFGIIVFDESQAFKTHTSQIHLAVTRLNAFHRIALSGTPVENNLNELWSLMNVLNPNLFGDIQNFQATFVRPITAQMEDSRRDLLRRLIAPYFLKRTKEEVLSDLPERQDEIVVCPMTDAQTSHYAEELSKARNEWLSNLKEGNHKLQTSNFKLQTIKGNHKVQSSKFKVQRIIQCLRQIANGEGKLSVVFEQLENLRQTQHKVLIFSEYVTLLQRVGSEMKKRGWTYDLLTGQTQQRQQVIDHFQQSPDCQFFLISLKAGGVGLNLTAADYVFILDPWWNHAAEEQAIARAHRIGQHRSVFVYRFVSENTLEQQILTLQDRKQSLIDSVMPFILKR